MIIQIISFIIQNIYRDSKNIIIKFVQEFFIRIEYVDGERHKH